MDAIDNYHVIVGHLHHLADDGGWEASEILAYLDDPSAWYHERLEWWETKRSAELMDGRGPKQKEAMRLQAIKRRMLMGSDVRPDSQAEELEMRAARNAQRENPGRPCGLCLAVGETICVGCSKIEGGRP